MINLLKYLIIDITTIIAAVRNGDQASFKILYQQYNGALYGIVYRILNKQDDAEEVLQNVFVKIWDNIGSYNSDKGTIFTWMSQIARNAALDRTRLKAYKVSAKTDSLDNVYGIGAEGDSANSDLEKIAKNLPEKYAVLIHKMFFEGYTQQEICDEMEIPLGTVKTRLRQAISMLRDTLQGEKHLLYSILLLLLVLIIVWMN